MAETSLQGDTIFQQMYSLLMAPIADFLPTNPDHKVAIVPQDALFLVPFAALMNAEEKYLIERHTLLMAPSVQVMQLTRDRYPRNSSFPPLVIGNPDMPTVPGQESPLIDLPGAATEADAIATLFNTQPLLGSQATEAEIVRRIQTAPILHFATHGLLDLDSNLNVYGDVVGNTQPTARDGNVFFEPGGIVVSGNVTINGVPANIALARERVYKVELAGALALTSTTQADGFLTSREIAQLDLQADLVVLSACDTGQGRITGDGVVGLARSFMVAGADSVIVSLWSIPDAPTAQLMISFYQEWEQQGDKAAALRTAMLTTAKEHPHPMNWAAFLLMGSSL
jgi:CHAT domain-containing protein